MTSFSTYKRTELAQRSTDGVDVTLFWLQGDNEDKALVCVRDRRQRAAYRESSNVDYDDGRLAA